MSEYTKKQKQADIDRGWRLYNAAIESCDDLLTHLDDLQGEHDIDTDKASEAAYDAWAILDSAYNTGGRILPAHSSDGGTT